MLSNTSIFGMIMQPASCDGGGQPVAKKLCPAGGSEAALDNGADGDASKLVAAAAAEQ